MKAWHFTADKLRDGRPIPDIGVRLEHEGPLVVCQSGLHASVRIIDALQYAPGELIHRVECGGDRHEDDDKIVCRQRTILWTVDGGTVLRDFARHCALDVIHLWDAPDVVREYLETGSEELRAAAWAAAWAAARGAAGDAQNARLEQMVRAAR